MHKTSWSRFVNSSSDNLKSKIQKRPRGRKWVGIVAVALTFVFGGAVAWAQQPKKIPLIGYLSGGNAAAHSTIVEAIRLALHERGYIEGQNIATEYRFAEGKRDRTLDLATDLARLNVDVILVAGGIADIQAAKNATKTIPIVMMGRGIDPVESGLVESLARPGGNVTGITNIQAALVGKRLELFKEAVPKLARVAVLYARENPSSVLAVKEDLPVAARALKLNLQSWAARAANDFNGIFTAMSKQRPDGLYMLGGALMRANQERIIGYALKSRLPSIYISREAVEAGGLMSYGADEEESYRRVAYYVDRILKGAKPADLPVEQPMKFEFVINLKTAKQIGLIIPSEVLARATKLIK